MVVPQRSQILPGKTFLLHLLKQVKQNSDKNSKSEIDPQFFSTNHIKAPQLRRIFDESVQKLRKILKKNFENKVDLSPACNF